MATYTWTLQGTNPTTIAATDIIQFAGAVFGAALFTGNYNDSTHVKAAAGTNLSLGNTPHNTKYLAAAYVSIDGAGSTALAAITNAECPLKINFAHGVGVVVDTHYIYAYDGVATVNVPTGVDFEIAEKGNAAWTAAMGSAAALHVGDRTSNTSHDFYFAISCSPSTVGLKSACVLRDELIYS